MVKMEADGETGDIWVSVDGETKDILNEFFGCFEVFLEGLARDRAAMEAFNGLLGDVYGHIWADFCS